MAFGVLRSHCASLFFEVVQRMTWNYSVKKKVVRPAQSFFLNHVGLIYLLQNPNVKKFVKYPFVQLWWIVTLHRRGHRQPLDTRISISKGFRYILSDDSLPSTDFFSAHPSSSRSRIIYIFIHSHVSYDSAMGQYTSGIKPKTSPSLLPNVGR